MRLERSRRDQFGRLNGTKAYLEGSSCSPLTSVDFTHRFDSTNRAKFISEPETDRAVPGELRPQDRV